jgi:hypothetical protein
METEGNTQPPRVTVDRLRALLESSGKGWGVLIAGTHADTQFVTWGALQRNSRPQRNSTFCNDIRLPVGFRAVRGYMQGRSTERERS